MRGYRLFWNGFHGPSEMSNKRFALTISNFIEFIRKSKYILIYLYFEYNSLWFFTIKIMNKYIIYIGILIMFTSCSMSIGGNKALLDDHSGKSLLWDMVQTWVLTPGHTGGTSTEKPEETGEHELTFSGNDNHSGSTLDTSLIEMDTLLEKN